jgi:hypothetical protein
MHPHAFSPHRALLASVVAALLVTAVACAPPQPPVPRVTTITIDTLKRPVRSTEIVPRNTPFWTAIANLELAGLDRQAMTGDERRFRDAMAMILEGDAQSAEVLLSSLYAAASDSLIRYRSRIALSGVLYAQEKWEELATLPRDPRVYDTGLGPDRATIESWADFFRRLPTTRMQFDLQPSIVPLSRTALGTPLVPVSVNGRPRLFWLDTGSSFTMLSSDVAMMAGVTPLADDTLEIVTTTGRVTARPAVIDSLRLGAVLFTHHPSMIVDAALLKLTVPGAPGESQVLAIDGIIGFDAIRRMDVEIDYGHDRVTLRAPGRRAGPSERNLFWIGYPVVRLRSPSGRAVHFGLDTGADETFATRTILEKVRAPRLIKDERRVEGIGGAFTVRVEMIPETRLALGTHVVRFRNLIVLPPRRTTFVNLDGVLGTNAWTGAKVRIDMTNGRVEIEAAR